MIFDVFDSFDMKKKDEQIYCFKLDKSKKNNLQSKWKKAKGYPKK